MNVECKLHLSAADILATVSKLQQSLANILYTFP